MPKWRENLSHYQLLHICPDIDRLGQSIAHCMHAVSYYISNELNIQRQIFLQLFVDDDQND